MAASNKWFAGNYRSRGDQVQLLPWEQHLEIDIWQEAGHCEEEKWVLRYAHRMYDAETQIVPFKPGFETPGRTTFKIEGFPHWIARGCITVKGEALCTEMGKVQLHLRQEGQGMTGLETWLSELEKTDAHGPDSRERHQKPQETASTVGYSSLLDRIASDYAADNAHPLKPRIDAVVIVRDGVALLEEYLGGMAAATPHIISSCTKSITSLLAGIAIDQQLFGLDDAVASHFPDVDTAWGQDPPVLVRHVLSMTVGTDKHTLDKALDLLASSDIEQLVLGGRREVAPGTRYDYDNGLPSLMGRLIERRSRMSLEAFAQKHLFGPLGIRGPIWTSMPKQRRDPSFDASVLASGGLYLRMADWVVLGQMLARGGVHQGRRLVSESYLLEATSRQTTPPDYPYGFYFHLNELGRVGRGPGKGQHLDGVSGYMALGQGEQILFVSPENGLVVAAFSSTWTRDPRDTSPVFGVLRCLNEAIIKSVE